MNGKAMMAGTTTPHIPSGAELVGSYIIVFVVHRPLPIFTPAQFAFIAGLLQGIRKFCTQMPVVSHTGHSLDSCSISKAQDKR